MSERFEFPKFTDLWIVDDLDERNIVHTDDGTKLSLRGTILSVISAALWGATVCFMRSVSCRFAIAVLGYKINMANKEAGRCIQTAVYHPIRATWWFVSTQIKYILATRSEDAVGDSLDYVNELFEKMTGGTDYERFIK